MGLLARKACKVSKEFKGCRVTLGQPAQLAPQAHKAFKAIKAPLAQRVTLGRPARPGLKEFKAMLAPPAHKEFKAIRVCKVKPALLAPLERRAR